MNGFISSVIEGSYRFSQKWDSGKPLPEFIGTMPLLFADLNLLRNASRISLNSTTGLLMLSTPILPHVMRQKELS